MKRPTSPMTNKLRTTCEGLAFVFGWTHNMYMLHLNCWHSVIMTHLKMSGKFCNCACGDCLLTLDNLAYALRNVSL